MSDNDLILQKLQELQKNFASTLEEKINAILDAKKSIDDNGYSEERLELLHRLVHSLVGVSAMFGYNSLSEICFEGDVYLRPFVKEKKEFKNEYMTEITQKINNIHEHFVNIKKV